MILKRIRQISIIILLCALWACGNNFRGANIKAVERLRQQLLDERFDEIYDESSNITRAQVPKEEFVKRIRAVDSELKSIDPKLEWQRVEESPEPAVYYDENWSSLKLENDGRKVNIQLDWGPPFKLCGMLISGDIPEGGNRPFRNCD